MKILSETTLNSIMFLLIPLAYSCNYHCRNALNSIMFLLIPQKWRIYEQSNANFKFHYVSINSVHDRCSHSRYIALNSIMFLLIRIYSCVYSAKNIALNSIMFLLIRNSHSDCGTARCNFKFHYVSINSIFRNDKVQL